MSVSFPPPGLAPPEATTTEEESKANPLDMLAKLNAKFKNSNSNENNKKDAVIPVDRRDRDYREERSRHKKDDRSRSSRFDRKKKRSDSNERFNPNEYVEKKSRRSSSPRSKRSPPRRKAPEDWVGASIVKKAMEKEKQSKKSSSSSKFSSSSHEKHEKSNLPEPANAGKSNKLWVDGLQRGSNDTIKCNFALRTMFGEHGSVVNVDLKITTTSRLKGQAVVTMATAEDATQAAKHLHRKPFLDHGDMTVEVVDPQADYRKKQRGGGRGGGRFGGGRGGGRGGGFSRGRSSGGRDRDGGRDGGSSGGYNRNRSGGSGGGRDYGSSGSRRRY